MAGTDQGDECKRTAIEVSKIFSISIKTGGLAEPQDESRGNLLTAWVVLGIKAA
jgi:hypothetical protein